VQLVRAILLRLLYGGFSLLFVSVVTFVAGALSPYDAATLQAGEKATLADVTLLRHQMGLDRPWPVRYAEYVWNALHGDLGKSLTGIKEPVRDILARCVPITAEIALLSILLAATVGIVFGIISSAYRNKSPDRVILSLSTLGVTIPNFVLAPILVYIFATRLNLLPTNWRLDRPEGDFYYLLLPVTILAARPAAVIMRLTRVSMIDTLQQEFIRTAIAKGVPRVRIYLGHALRNAILPVCTAIGTNFGFLLTGSFVIDRAFTIPGIGSRTIEAIVSNDMPVVQACVIVTGAMFILLNTLIDMALPIIDPRIRESQV
jgi:ABC-type dipeptide/oligopeptide/nickel transport system permease component